MLANIYIKQNRNHARNVAVFILPLTSSIHIVINDYVYPGRHRNVTFGNKHSECNLLAAYHGYFSFT